MSLATPGPTSHAPVAFSPADELEDETTIELSPGARYNAPTMLFLGYAIVSAVGLGLALIMQRPELVVVAAPALVLLAVGTIDGRYPSVVVTAALETPRVLEGEPTRIRVTLSSAEDVRIVEVELGDNRVFESVGSQRHVIALRRRRPRTLAFPVVPFDWGVLQLPTFSVRTRRTSGLFASTIEYRCVGSLRVHINEEPVRALIEPNAFRLVVGSHLSGERGDGCEIADIRPYHQGDRLQSINWRISARHDEPWVTLRHPDRSTTIVLIVDAFGNFTSGERNTLRHSVRAALGLARLHLNTQDPVGLLLTGHGQRWIRPHLGLDHLATMTDALLELSTQEWPDRAQKGHRVDRLVPVDSVVIAISPLLNDAFGQLLEPLLARGQNVHVIEPTYRLPADILVSSRDDNGDPTMAWRVFELEHHLRRRALTDMGASVSPWGEDQTIESILMDLRRAQRARLATSRRALR